MRIILVIVKFVSCKFQSHSNKDAKRTSLGSAQNMFFQEIKDIFANKLLIILIDFWSALFSSSLVGKSCWSFLGYTVHVITIATLSSRSLKLMAFSEASKRHISLINNTWQRLICMYLFCCDSVWNDGALFVNFMAQKVDNLYFIVQRRLIWNNSGIYGVIYVLFKRALSMFSCINL